MKNPSVAVHGGIPGRRWDIGTVHANNVIEAPSTRSFGPPRECPTKSMNKEC